MPVWAVAATAGLSVAAYVTAYRLIGAESVKLSFIKAKLFGRDLNKTSEDKVPEGLGVVSAAVYLVALFLLIPILFYHQLEGQSFRHDEFSQFICALLSICCMIFLGFTDDVLDLRWRYKLLLPTLASLPLLMVYFVNGGSTTIVVPYPLQSVLGVHLNLSVLYYVYMGMLAVFCTNAINILAGINGVEVGQSVIIALSILLFNLTELFTSSNLTSHHTFSLHLLLPFTAVSVALLRHNWYPSAVFVGDTYCNFAGMTFAVIGIFGHFSKTLLLFFIPQILNFLYSIPQLFRIIPCPRHRLPKFDPSTGLLGMSYAEFPENSLSPGILSLLKLARGLGLVTMETGVGDKKDLVRVNNLTIINFVLKWVGPTHEERLTTYMMAIQVLGTVLAFTIRYGLVHFFYA